VGNLILFFPAEFDKSTFFYNNWYEFMWALLEKLNPFANIVN